MIPSPACPEPVEGPVLLALSEAEGSPDGHRGRRSGRGKGKGITYNSCLKNSLSPGGEGLGEGDLSALGGSGGLKKPTEWNKIEKTWERGRDNCGEG